MIHNTSHGWRVLLRPGWSVSTTHAESLANLSVIGKTHCGGKSRQDQQDEQNLHDYSKNPVNLDNPV
ncbi:MAG TPA: hypothetical protein VID27_11360, partial [Blastocatellia bacterium]